MIPENEMGVIVLFTQLAEEAGFEIISINSRFPDAIIRHEGIEYRAEFEFQSSNFRQHRHDPRNCDLIIAWLHDFPDCALTVLALSDPDWARQKIRLPLPIEREMGYWQMRATLAEAEVLNLKRQLTGKEAEKEYRCNACEREFETVQALNAHQRFCANKENSNGAEKLAESEKV